MDGACSLPLLRASCRRTDSNESETSRVEIIPSFVLALEHRLEFEEQELRPIAGQLADVCRYILANYSVLGDLPPTEEQTKALQESVRRKLSKLKDLLGEEVLEKDYVDLRPRLRSLVHAFSKLGEA